MNLKKHIILLLLLVSRAAVYPAVAQDNGRLNDLLRESDIQKQINILFSISDEKERVKTIDEGIRQNPSNAGYYYLRGIINNGREKYSKALDDFTRAIEMNPGNNLIYRCYLGRGVSYMSLLEYDQALADLNTSIEKNDTVAGAYYSRGMVNYELKEYDAAIKDFKKILEFSEGNGELYFNLGMAYFRMEERDQACRNLNKACTLGNTNACRMSLMQCAKAIPTIP